MRYAVGPFELDAARAVLAVRGEPVALGPRVVATLTALVERPGEVVTKDEILDRVWSGEDVGESNVAQSVYSLRKTMREHGLDGAIATVPRRGYRFTGPVTRVPERAQPTITLAGAPPVRRPVFGRTAAAVAAALVLLAVPGARANVHAPALSGRAAEQYRLGRYYWNLRTLDGLSKARALFESVVASNPRNALGYAGLADADLMTADYYEKVAHDRAAPARYLARARSEIAQALALDPESAPAHTSSAMLLSVANVDQRAAESEFRRALALDPGYAPAHHWYGTMLFREARLGEASRELHAATALEPVSAATDVWLAESSYYDHRYADAIAYAKRALDLDPNRLDALHRLGLAYEMNGDLPRAIAVFRRLRRYAEMADDAAAMLAEAYARAGRVRDARVALRAAGTRTDAGNLALAMIALGERARGLAVIARMERKYGRSGVIEPRLEPYESALHRRAAG